MNVTFTQDALDEYVEWQSKDKKMLSRINQLIQSIQRDGFMQGLGKPEPLKGRKAYSRCINDENRLVYIGDSERNLIILSCQGHYGD